MQTLPVGDRACGRSSFVSRFDKRWLGISMAAAGAAAATESAEAAIQYFAPVGGVNVPVTAIGVYINAQTGASATSYAAVGGAPSPAMNLWGTTAFRAYWYPTASTDNRYVVSGADLANLAPNTLIDGASTYAASATTLFSTGAFWNNTAGASGLIGFKFRNTANTNTYYGWARLEVNPWAGGLYSGGKVIDWAYDDTGAGIGAGVVPEPTGLALLAAGAAGLMARRRVA